MAETPEIRSVTAIVERTTFARPALILVLRLATHELRLDQLFKPQEGFCVDPSTEFSWLQSREEEQHRQQPR
jgi:hypothetical protein